MDEFEKIKTFSEGLAERQQNVTPETQKDENSDIDFPQYLSSFRARPATEEKESKTLLWVVLGLSSLITLVVMALLLPRFSEVDDEELIVISPTPEPVKVLPENPGGLAIPDRDKVVYERGDVTTPAPVVENLFPEPEQPMLPSVVIEPEAKEEMPVVAEQPDLSKDAEVVAPLVLEEIPMDNQDEPFVLSTEEATPPAVVEVIEEKPEPAPEKVEAPVLPINTEVWRAQLLSSSDKSKVESSWKNILKQQAALLSDMPYQIVSATIPGKGTFWRLQVGEFSSKDMAQNLCAKLKKKKQECIPVK